MVCSLTQANAGTRFSYLQQKHLIIKMSTGVAHLMHQSVLIKNLIYVYFVI